MTWTQFVPYPNHENLGSVVSCYLNEDKTLIKRVFTEGGITSNGNPNQKSKDYIEQKWQTESFILDKLSDEIFVPKLIEINHAQRYTIQRYYGPDLLSRQFDDIADIEDQICFAYRKIWDMGYYKMNGALANMTRYGNRVILFDFKYMRERSEEFRTYEEYSIDTWLSKVSNTMAPRLKKMLL